MTASTEGARRAPFLPEAASKFLRRRSIQLSGLCLLAFAVFLVISLITYSPSDPSLNTANSTDVSNLMGIPGALLSDVLLQAVGAGSGLLVLVAIAWTWALLSCRRIKLLWLRAVLCPLSVVLAAMGCACLKAPIGWPIAAGFGGSVGEIITLPLIGLLQSWEAVHIALPIIVFFLALISFCISLGLPWNEWRVLFQAAWKICRTTTVFVFRIVKWVHVKSAPSFNTSTTRSNPTNRKQTPRLLSKKLSKIKELSHFSRLQRSPNHKHSEPTLYANQKESLNDWEEPTIHTSGLTRKLVEESSDTMKQGKRATRENQQALDLNQSNEFELPALNLLNLPNERNRKPALSANAREQNADLLLTVLEDFGVFGLIDKVRPGPVVTLYEFIPRAGTRTARVIALSDDIARSMSAVSVRVATIRGRNVIGIELPNNDREMVLLRELLASENYENTSATLTLALGKDIGGNPVIADLTRMPHLLVAGTTGSGKSVAVNSMILSLIYRLPPDQCKLILIDPKMLELSVYDDIPHLLTPVVTDPTKAVVALKWTVREMESRYQAMSKLGVRNISGYNKRLNEARKKGETLSRRVHTHFDSETGDPVYEEQPLDLSPMPLIVVVVDEMADLMLVAGKDIENAVQRLAQMARAAGIHIIMATQRPSVDVITGTIKANFPTRISFQVTSKIDSRTILGDSGAEQLLGQGDMLYLEGGGRLTRVHGPLVSDSEVEAVTNALRKQGKPDYITTITEDPNITPEGNVSSEDPLYDKALQLVVRENKASTSFIQRHLQIGYNRAARIVERMETQGVISQANHAGKREVLIGEIGSFNM